MSFQSVIATINELKKEKIIADYAIYGGYAITYYLEPAYTYDLDIIILVNSNDDFHELYKYFRKKGNKIENVYIFIDDMPVQFFPGYGGDIFEEAVRHAHKIKIKDLPSKVVNVEYLIAMLLKSYRPKDKIRIAELLPKANVDTLKEIIKRHDNENDRLQIKYKELRRTLQAGQGK
ncbi:MAG TPA: hypothetical protein VMW86_08190 [Dehalococcoidales bacterium]|nr:hypothetical protein [Dehalococcoidales bacterium]